MAAAVETRLSVVEVSVVSILGGAAAIVPCVFTSRLTDSFVLPKLAVLWAVLACCFAAVGVGIASGRSTGVGLRWVGQVDIVAAGFVGLNVLAALFSTDPHQSLFGERFQYQGLLTVGLYGAFFLLARHACADPRRLRLLLLAVLAGAVAVSGYAIVQKTGRDPVWDGAPFFGRAFSSLGQPNSLAAYLLLAVAPAAHFARTTVGALRLASVAAGVLVIAAIGFTESRGGYAGLVVVGVLLVVFHTRGQPRARRMIAGVVLAVAIGVAVIPPTRDAAAGAVDKLRNLGGQGSLSVDNHVDSWRVAIRIAADHPAFGTGQETFPDVFPGYSRQVLSAERVAHFDQYRVESAHNVPLNIAATTGLPAVVAYAALVLGFVALALRAASTTEDRDTGMALIAVVIAVCGHVVTDLFMSSELTATWLTWMLVGAAVGTVSARTDTR